MSSFTNNMDKFWRIESICKKQMYIDFLLECDFTCTRSVEQCFEIAHQVYKKLADINNNNNNFLTLDDCKCFSFLKEWDHLKFSSEIVQEIVHRVYDLYMLTSFDPIYNETWLEFAIEHLKFLPHYKKSDYTVDLYTFVQDLKNVRKCQFLEWIKCCKITKLRSEQMCERAAQAALEKLGSRTCFLFCECLQTCQIEDFDVLQEFDDFVKAIVMTIKNIELLFELEIGDNQQWLDSAMILLKFFISKSLNKD